MSGSAPSPLLWRASLRHLRRHPTQAALAVLGVALGVAVVVSIDLANTSAARAFELSNAAIAGRATHQVVAGPGGLPDEAFTRLVVDLGLTAAPVVEGTIRVPRPGGTSAGVSQGPRGSHDRDARQLRLLGVDPFSEAPFRAYLGSRALPSSGTASAGGVLTELLTRPGACLLARATAGELGLAPGDELDVVAGGVPRRLLLAALLDPADALSAEALAGLVITDIASAQELLGRAGTLSRIDLLLPEGAARERALAAVRGVLPGDAALLPAAARASARGELTRAFATNLTAMSLLALVCGLFLIYNTMSFSVAQRRSAIGVLRALGVTRREVFALVLGEALVVGAAGTALGLLAGVGLARGLLDLVARTINDLYFAVEVRRVAVGLPALAKAMLLGIAATALAALRPAREAAAVPPRLAWLRSEVERRAWRALPATLAAGAGALAAGALLIAAAGRNLPWTFAGLFAALLGCALLTPAATALLSRLVEPLAGWAGGLPGRMAARGVRAALSRTAVAIAALMIAVAVAIGVGVMVGSFRRAVESWLGSTLRADLYITPESGPGRPALPPDLPARLAALPGVDRVNQVRSVRLEGSAGVVNVAAVDLDARSYPAFELIETTGGPPPTTPTTPEAAAAWAAFEGGAVVITEPFAYRRGLGAGDQVNLLTAAGERGFPIAGVFRDYSSEQGAVWMDLATYRRHWRDQGISGVSLFAAPGADLARLRRDAEEEVAAATAVTEVPIAIRSNRALREASLRIFDRTFAITGVLRLLTAAVAFVGVLAALMALALDRERELAVLRAQGLTPRQLIALLTAESGLMGAIAGLLAVPVGIGLAAVMVHVVNRRSFGWSMRLSVEPAELALAVGLALLAALGAGFYPSLRMARTPPAVALRGEGGGGE